MITLDCNLLEARILLKINEETKSIAVSRLTALWALSEAALGGLLHALHLPLTGIIVGSAAIIFITLIAHFSEKSSSILKATLIVLIVKGIVSPHTPPAAYFAVFLQGFLGQLIFYSKDYFSFKVIALSVTTLVYFSIQKLVIYTIVFGNTFWDSINVYTNFILSQFYSSTNSSEPVNFSLIIISVYVSIHFLAGLFVGRLAEKLPHLIQNSNSYDLGFQKLVDDEILLKKKDQSEHLNNSKKKFKRKYFVLVFLIGLIIVSYLIPNLGSNRAMDLLLMMLRAIIITFIWYIIISPLILKLIKNYFKKYRNIYAEEVEEIILLIPHFKNLTIQSWKIHSQKKGFKRFKPFLMNTFSNLLFTKITD